MSVYQRVCSWTTAFRRLRCFVDIVGLGWGGACINVHVSLLMKTCYFVAAGRCMYSWVGWGGAGRGMY